MEFDKINVSDFDALPIGKSGVLKGRNATTYDLLDGLRRKQLSDYGATILDLQLE